MASVYLTKDDLRIVRYGETTAGLTTAHGPVCFMKISDGVSVLGENALDALNDFTLGLPNLKGRECDLKHKHFLERMEVKSWRNFVKGTRKVEIESLDDDLIKITPMKNLIDAKIKGKGDFDWLKERSRTVSREPQALGEAILAAFEDCE